MLSRLPVLVAQRPYISAALLSVLLLVTAAATWVWAHAGHDPLPTRGATVDVEKGLVMLSPEARQALGVQTAEVGLEALAERTTAAALVVAPWKGRAYVTIPLNGKITATHVRPGQTVRRGQPLLDVQGMELESLRLELLDAQNRAQLAARNLRRSEELSQRGVISEQQLLEDRARHQEHLNAIESARRKLLTLGVDEITLTRLLETHQSQLLQAVTVKSPIAGVVSHAHVQMGQMVEASEHLFEIIDLSTVWVQVSVLEKDLPRMEEPRLRQLMTLFAADQPLALAVNRNAAATVGQPVEITFAAYPGEVFRGTVQVKGSALDPKTAQGMLWVELVNPPGESTRLLPGMYGQAEVIRAGSKKLVTVPAAALVRDGAEHYVLLEEAPGQYVRRNIVVGRQARGLVEVRSGQLIPRFDRVVTVGSHELGSLLEQGVLRLSAEAAQSIGLVVQRPRHLPVAQVVQLNGVVELPPNRQAVVAARLPGTLRRLHIDREQSVRAGEVLAEIASLELQDLQLQLLNSHQKLGLLEQALARLRPLAQQAALSARQLRETESTHQATLQQRDSLRRKLLGIGVAPEQVRELGLEQRQLIDALPVRAPIAGVVVRFQGTLGQAVKMGDPLFEIHDPSRVLVRGYLSEQQVARVQIGQAVRVRVVGDPDAVLTGVVAGSGQAFGTDSRSLSVWVELTGPARLPLAHGMLARLAVVVSESSPTLTVPREAVLQEGLREGLFLRQPDGRFERRLVRTGRRDDRLVEVTHGLAPTDEVAVSGVAELQTAFASLR